MPRRVRTVVAASALALLAGAAVGHARMPADLATAQPAPHVVHPSPRMGDEAPTRAQAEAWYYTHLGPSLAWRRATPTERRHAERSYLADWEGGEGCTADLRHAYQGTVAHPEWVQPSLPANTAPGSDLLLAEYTDGICGD